MCLIPVHPCADQRIHLLLPANPHFHLQIDLYHISATEQDPALRDQPCALHCRIAGSFGIEILSLIGMPFEAKVLDRALRPAFTEIVSNQIADRHRPALKQLFEQFEKQTVPLFIPVRLLHLAPDIQSHRLTRYLSGTCDRRSI